MSGIKKIIVFTDLDGSLLDHSDYSYAAAQSALDRLQNNDIPVLPVTSKTLAEIKGYDALFANVPKVGENGMVIDLPEGYFGAAEYLVPGHSYAEIRAEVEGLPSPLRCHFNGFFDMGLDGVIEATGLPQDRARDAYNRQASEPFLWSGSAAELADMHDLLALKGYKITQGGRFYHLMSDGGKDRALSLLIEKFQVASPDKQIISIALGDGPNDADMIGTATYGVKIPNDKGAVFEVEHPKGTIINARYAGPKGWSDSVHSLLDELGLSR
ncbi:MAG: HAD-IIB family hydrolase [Alphaproteobacteria bacterium]